MEWLQISDCLMKPKHRLSVDAFLCFLIHAGASSLDGVFEYAHPWHVNNAQDWYELLSGRSPNGSFAKRPVEQATLNDLPSAN